MNRSSLMRLLGFLAPSRGTALLAVLAALAAVLSSVGLVATAAWLISAAALRPSIAALQVAIVLVRFFGLGRGVFRYLERLLTHTVTLGVLARLRAWFYRRIEPLAPAGLVHARSGDLLARMVADIETLENVYARLLSPVLVALLVSGGSVLVLGLVYPPLALAQGAGLLLAGAVLPWASARLARQPERDLAGQRQALRAGLVDTLQGAPDLLAFNAEAAQLARLLESETAVARQQARLAWVRGLSSALGVVFSNGAMLAVLALAIAGSSLGRLDPVWLAALVLGSLACFEAVQPLPAAFQGLESARLAARRVFTLADQKPQVSEPEHPLPFPPPAAPGQRLPALAVCGLRFTYPGEPRPVLDDFDLVVQPSERVALWGPSGSGKTTLLHLLLRFWEYQAGEILVNGQDLRSCSPEALRGWFGMLSQPPVLFYDTVRGNLLLGNPRATPEQVEEAARQAQIHDFLAGLPQGYDTLVGERGLRLSRGQRQRLALARLLLKGHPFLLLDEPTAGLDPRTASQLLQTLHAAVFPGRTVLLVTHDPRCLEGMDRVEGF